MTTKNQTDLEQNHPEPTALRKRSMVIAGHRSSISLENIFWQQFRAIAAKRGQSLASLAAEIDETRGEANLSSAIRVFVLTETMTHATRNEAE